MKSYDQYVQDARAMVSNIEQMKAKVAEIAIKVCEIRHGGRSDGFYTVKDFAEDIGINPKSLQNWIYVYRDVIKKIGIVNPTKSEWSSATKTCNLLKTQRQVDNKSMGSVGTRRAYKKEVPVSAVKKVFDDVHSGNSALMKFERIYSSTQYNLTMIKEINLHDIDRKKMISVMEWLDECSDFINDHLSKHKKGVQ